MANTSILAAFERMWQHVVAGFGNKADVDHSHDDRYYTETEIDSKISTVNTSINNITGGTTKVGNATSADTATSATSATKATKDASGNVITDTYETKSDASAKLNEAKEYTNTKTSNLASTTVVDNKVSAHNTSTSAHNDIRDLINGLTSRLNALADSDDITLDQMSEIVDSIKTNKSLIDSITTSKVNVADIVNNLTTNVTNKPLSAAQGVAIKSLIDALQSSLNAKQATITGGASTITSSNLTASRALVSDSSGKVGVSAVTSTELGYLDGVTSNIQTQLNGKAASLHAHSSITCVELTDEDLDDLKPDNVTFYYAAGGNTVANNPNAGAAFGMYVYRAAAGLRVQEYTTNNRQKMIRHWDGSAWSVWKTLAFTDIATQSAQGLMSAADKKKLDGIATSANAYSLPAAGSSLGGVKTGGDVTISSGVITVNDDSHNHTIANVDGLQSSLDGKVSKSGDTMTGSLNVSKTINDVVYKATLGVSGSGTAYMSHYTDDTEDNYIALSSTDSRANKPWTIASGGTGATTAAGALTNLGITATAAELNKLDGVTATTAELNYVDGVTSNIQTQLNGKLSTSGTASKATALTTSAGSATQPVYFSSGKPVACTYTIGKSVPSNAVFTDTNTKVTNTLATTTKAYVTGTTSASTNTGTQVFDTGVYLGTTAGRLHVGSIAIGSGIITYDSTNSAIKISFS